jgi:hypothetical protein
MGIDGGIDLSDAPFGINRELRHHEVGAQFPFKVIDDRLDCGALFDFDVARLLIARPTHMGHENGAASPVHDAIQGSQGYFDTVGVTNFSLLDDIVVDSNQDDFIL